MSLLAFKYLPIRGARLEGVRVNWPLQEAAAECRILDDVRESVITILFRRVTMLHLRLGDDASRESARITQCSEKAGTFKIATAAGGGVEVAAGGYDVR